MALALAFFDLRFLIAEVKRFIKKPTDKSYWLYLHIGVMIGGYIATFTAFLVNVIHSDYPILLWLTPVTLFYPFMVYTMRKFRNKLNKGRAISDLATIKIGI